MCRPLLHPLSTISLQTILRRVALIRVDSRGSVLQEAREEEEEEEAVEVETEEVAEVETVAEGRVASRPEEAEAPRGRRCPRSS